MRWRADQLRQAMCPCQGRLAGQLARFSDPPTDAALRCYRVHETSSLCHILAPTDPGYLTTACPLWISIYVRASARLQTDNTFTAATSCCRVCLTFSLALHPNLPTSDVFSGMQCESQSTGKFELLPSNAYLFPGILMFETF
jgi:hypothetical protein